MAWLDQADASVRDALLALVLWAFILALAFAPMPVALILGFIGILLLGQR